MTQRSDEPPPLDVHVYAETLARLQHHPPELAPRILKGIGLKESQWAPIRDQWTRLIEDDMERGALVTAFAATFSATRRRLLEHGESLPATPDLEHAPAAAPVPSDPWAGLPTAMRRFSSMIGTEVASDVPVVPVQPALPFVPAAAEGDGAARPASPPASDAWAGLPPGMRGFSSMTGTEIASNVPSKPSLPFAPGGEPTAGPGLPPAADAWTGLPPGMRGFSSMTGTEIASDVPAGPVLPFSRAASPASESPPCGLSLERAASLHVELASLGSGASHGDVLRRYGLTGDQHREVTHFWGSRTASDPSFRERWEAACAAYRAWLLQGSQSR